MKKTRIFSLIALVLAMLMVFAACAPAATDNKSNDSEQTTPADTQQTEEPAKTDDAAAQTPAEPMTITYCNFNSSGGNEETLQKMVEAFEDTHENIKIEVETIGYDDYFTQMQTRVAGGTAPDCYELNIENFAAYANKGLLAEITGQDLSGLNETALGAFNVNGKQYGLPESFSNVVLIYNKDLFDQAGVTYPTDDWTQDDVQNAAEKIRALGDDIFGIWQPITYNEFFKVVAQYGGSLLNEDKTQFTINSEENIKAAQTLVDRVLVSNVQPNSVQQGGMGDWDMFMSGRLGMIPTGIWAFQTFTENCDFAWDIAVEPGSTQKATHFFSNCVVMNPETEHPEEVAEWLAWLTSSTESADIRLAAGWDLPALKDLNALSSYLEITPPDNRKAVFESLDYLVMPPVIEDYALMSDIIGQYLSAAADGTMTVTDALNAAQADCEAQITLGYLQTMTPADLDEDVRSTLLKLRADGHKLAVGSSSKNAPLILERIGLGSFFDAVADGTQITHSKPDPEVFLLAAKLLGVKPDDALVVEDAEAGIQAAKAGGFCAAGIGPAANSLLADFRLQKLSDLLKTPA